MKSTTRAMALLVGFGAVLAGCEGAHWANFLTLGVTASLFFGTLNLNRRPRSEAPTATSAAPRLR